MQEIFQGQNIRLQTVAPQQEMADRLAALIKENKKFLERFFPKVSKLDTPKAMMRDLEQMADAQKTNKVIDYYIFLKDTQTPIGQVSVWMHPHRTELMCWVGEKYPQNYMHEALGIIEPAVYKQFNKPVVLRIEVGNTELFTVARKAGFERMPTSGFFIKTYQKHQTYATIEKFKVCDHSKFAQLEKKRRGNGRNGRGGRGFF